MKFNFKDKNKETNIETDVEKIVEKGMDYHNKDWKDKFDTKHKANKELLKIKHEQKLEKIEADSKKRTWVDKAQENNIKSNQLKIKEEIRLKELEFEQKKQLLELEFEHKRKLMELQLEEKKLKEEKKRISIKNKTIASIVLLALGITFIIINNDFESPLFDIISLFSLLAIPLIWFFSDNNDVDDDFGYSTLSLKYEYMLEEFNKLKKELKLENGDDINKALEYLDDFSKKLN